MKTTNLKWIAISLSALMLMQSCRVYDKTTSTVDEALISTSRIKAKTFVDVTYEFDDLIREDGKLYGITKRNTSTAKKLTHQIVDDNLGDRLVKIVVLENTIKSYHLFNKSKSTFASILLPVSILVVIIGIGAATIDMSWGSGGSMGEIQF